MANRVIRDSLWNSPSLAKLSREADAWFPRWILLADDWGCFQADPRIVKGVAYPLREDVLASECEAWLVEYYNAGLIFLWMEGERLWGYFTAFQTHNTYLQKTTVSDKGEPTKTRRRSPEPPQNEILSYLKGRQRVEHISDIFRQSPTPSDKILVSVSVSKSESISESKDKYKDIPGETPAKVCTPQEEFNETELEENKAGIAGIVEGLAQDMTPENKRFRPRSQNQRLLDQEIKQAQAVYARQFGKHIDPPKIMLLVNGRNGKRYNCFGSIPTLIEFWRDQQKDIENPFTFSLVSAENPQTVARYEKRAFEAK